MHAEVGFSPPHHTPSRRAVSTHIYREVIPGCLMTCNRFYPSRQLGVRAKREKKRKNDFKKKNSENIMEEVGGDWCWETARKNSIWEDYRWTLNNFSARTKNSSEYNRITRNHFWESKEDGKAWQKDGRGEKGEFGWIVAWVAGWLVRRVAGWMSGCVNGWMDSPRKECATHMCLDVRRDTWMSGWIPRWTAG